MAGLPILELTDAAQELAGQLIGHGLVPKTSVEDSLHIALATVHGMDFLLTWNFRHINNAEMKARIGAAIEAAPMRAFISALLMWRKFHVNRKSMP